MNFIDFLIISLLIVIGLLHTILTMKKVQIINGEFYKNISGDIFYKNAIDMVKNIVQLDSIDMSILDPSLNIEPIHPNNYIYSIYENLLNITNIKELIGFDLTFYVGDIDHTTYRFNNNLIINRKYIDNPYIPIILCREVSKIILIQDARVAQHKLLLALSLDIFNIFELKKLLSDNILKSDILSIILCIDFGIPKSLLLDYIKDIHNYPNEDGVHHPIYSVETLTWDRRFFNFIWALKRI